MDHKQFLEQVIENIADMKARFDTIEKAGGKLMFTEADYARLLKNVQDIEIGLEGIKYGLVKPIIKQWDALVARVLACNPSGAN